MTPFSFVIYTCMTACIMPSSSFSNLGGAGDDGSGPSRKQNPPNTHYIDANPVFHDEDNDSEEENNNAGGASRCSNMWQSWLRWRRELLPDLQLGNLFVFISYICEICDKRFPTNNALCGHMRTHLLEHPWLGVLPPAAGRPKAEGEMHSDNLIESLGRGDVPRPDRRYWCSACLKEFKSKQSLGGHRASHKNRPGCFAKEKRGLVPVYAGARRKMAVPVKWPKIPGHPKLEVMNEGRSVVDHPMFESQLNRQSLPKWADGASASSAHSPTVTDTAAGVDAPAGEPSTAMEERGSKKGEGGGGGGSRRIMMDFDLNLPAESYPDNENTDEEVKLGHLDQ